MIFMTIKIPQNLQRLSYWVKVVAELDQLSEFRHEGVLVCGPLNYFTLFIWCYRSNDMPNHQNDFILVIEPFTCQVSDRVVWRLRQCTDDDGGHFAVLFVMGAGFGQGSQLFDQLRSRREVHHCQLFLSLGLKPNGIN
jgi:hypothetical protein